MYKGLVFERVGGGAYHAVYPPPALTAAPPRDGHVNLTVLSIFQKAVTFDHNLTH